MDELFVRGYWWVEKGIREFLKSTLLNRMPLRRGHIVTPLNAL